MKKAMSHLKKAHTALSNGDVQTGRFHIGHALAATRTGSVAEEANPAEREPDTDQDDAPNPMLTARARLARLNRKGK